MTIKITAQSLPSDTTRRIIALCNILILQKGNYGNYSSNKGFFKLTLHLKELYPEIQDMMSLLSDSITEFDCGPTETEVSETFGVTECPQTSLEDEEHITPLVKVESREQSKKIVEELLSEEIKEPATGLISTEIVVPPVQEITATITDTKQAVYAMFNDVSGKKSAKEIADIVIDHLGFSKVFYKKSLKNISKMIVAYVNAEEKPESFEKLRSLADVELSYVQSSKLNSVTKKVFFEKYNITVTFLQCMLYVCERLSNDSSDSLDSEFPEEVILPPPEKPPDEEACIVPLERLSDLHDFIQNLNSDTPLQIKLKQLLNFMGLQKFKPIIRPTLERLFYSIIIHKETNLNDLFEFDISLKRLSTADGSKRLVKRLLESFLEKKISEDFITDFLKNLINEFSVFVPIEKTSESKHYTFKSNQEQRTKQEHGELYCFPKNEEFDSFIKKDVKYRSITKIKKIRKILEYMGIERLPKNDSKFIYKFCCDLTILNAANHIQLYSLQETEIIERFINDFAKGLNPDANFISLQNFLICLRSLP